MTRRAERQAARDLLGADAGTPVWWGPVERPAIVGAAIVVPAAPGLLLGLTAQELADAADAAEALAESHEREAAELRERAERLRQERR